MLTCCLQKVPLSTPPASSPILEDELDLFAAMAGQRQEGRGVIANVKAVNQISITRDCCWIKF